MKRIFMQLAICTLLLSPLLLRAQEEDKTTISGSMLTDERFLLDNGNDWAWNEQRVALFLDHKLAGKYKFHSELWLRNLGLPNMTQSSHLYNKGIVDPVKAEIREAYVQLNGFLFKNLDLTVGRQRLVWGAADRLNPTDNLNPADMEDILDFGRHRGSDAINLMFYPFRDFSLQAVYIPRFSPASLPIGIFANILTPTMELPMGMIPQQVTDTLLLPSYNLAQGATFGFRAKGFAAGIDFSASYLWGRDALPQVTGVTLSPFGSAPVGLAINAELSWPRFHIFGLDISTTLAGIGLWGETALHLPERDVVMHTDMSPLFPGFPVIDSVLLLKSEPFLKYIVGGDYHFSDGSYLNLQYMHGFVHERGRKDLKDYLFIRFEKSFFREKLMIAPLNGALVATDWNDIKNGYAVVYIPEVTYKANQNTELTLSAAFFQGKGDNLFTSLKDYDMMILKLKHSF